MNASALSCGALSDPADRQPLAGKTIGLLTASASRLGGGVFEAVVAQAELIRRCGGTPRVFALRDGHSAEDAARFAPTAVTTFRVSGPAQIGYAADLVPALIGAGLDCLHLHGIWMYPSRAAGQWARRTGRPTIVSPHGMLDPWITGRGVWKKRLARIGYERTSWRRAALLHALTGDEAADIARETRRSAVVVIPNPAPPADAAPVVPRPPRLAYVGRIHPKKNLTGLVEGWRRARLDSEARLTIAGWGDEADIAHLRRAVALAGPSVEFVGPLFGEAKQRLLREARFTALASFSEGLPMSVLEGWAAGTPSIQTAACHLPEGPAAGAALPCEPDPASLARAIERAFALDPAEWLRMAQAAHALAAGRFSAATVAAQWGDAYRSAMRVSDSPDP